MNFANETRKNETSKKCAEGRQDGSSNSYRVLSLQWNNHHELHRGWRQRRRFLRHLLKDPLEHGHAT